MKIHFLYTCAFLALTPLWALSQESEINDFNFKFSTPAPSGDVTTYIYLIDEFLMVEKNMNRICTSGNQTAYSLTRIPIESIDNIHISQFGGEFAVFINSAKSGIDKKMTVYIDCSGQTYNPAQRLSSIISTGPNEALALNIADKIRKKLGI